MIDQLKQTIAEFERQNGRVPTIRELARIRRIRTSELRHLIGDLLAEEKSDGTSAFGASLREILLGGPGRQGSLHPDGGRIKDRQVCLIDEDGSELGVVSTSDALLMAREKNLDLFLVKPDAKPPMARLMDHGRYKFENEKRARLAKKMHVSPGLKELKMSLKIGDHDYQIKLRSAQTILTDGDNIRLQIMLRGREIEHADLAVALLNRFALDLGELAVWNDEPKVELNMVVLMLSPSQHCAP